MLELQSALIMLEHITKAEADIDQIDSQESRTELSARYGGISPYPAMYGALHAQAKSALGIAQRALDALRKGIAEVERLERLDSAMQEFGIDSERDLVLLEALAGTSPAPSDNWRTDRNELRDSLLSTLTEIEEDRWEKEKASTDEALKAAGFTEDDVMSDSWTRGQDHVSIDLHRVRKNDHYPSGYKFSFTRDGVAVAGGVSGEFAGLLEAVKAPTAEPSTPCVETSSVVDGGEA